MTKDKRVVAVNVEALRDDISSLELLGANVPYDKTASQYRVYAGMHRFVEVALGELGNPESVLDDNEAGAEPKPDAG